jgi:hypothetical protein
VIRDRVISERDVTITQLVTRPALGHHCVAVSLLVTPTMVRLSALVVVALFATSNAALLPTSEQQQLVTNQGSPVHATEGWSYEDCGQSYLARRSYHSLLILLPPFYRLPN